MTSKGFIVLYVTECVHVDPS